MEYSPEFISDFGRRTLLNLNRIQAAELDGEPDVFPVTQLWNSLLGLVVLPRESDESLIPETPLADFWDEGRAPITERIGKSDTLRELVRHLRNAVAHAGVEFEPNDKREIAKLTLWNYPPRCQDRRRENRNWEASVTVDDLQELARRIASTYVDVFAKV